MDYDKSITLVAGLFQPCVRDGDSVIELRPCLTLQAAQQVLDQFPPDHGDKLGYSSLATSYSCDSRSWFELKSEMEDKFEDFVTKAEACR